MSKDMENDRLRIRYYNALFQSYLAPQREGAVAQQGASRSQRAGLQFPVGRVHRLLR